MGARTTARLCCALAVLVCASLAEATHAVPARVTRVTDGETLTAYTGNGTRLRVRLLGIDAPKPAQGSAPAQPFAEEARAYLEQLVGGQRVEVHIFGLDRAKRSLAIVVRPDRRVANVEMVRAGLATVDRATPCQTLCRELEQAERAARQACVGIWGHGSKREGAGGGC